MMSDEIQSCTSAFHTLTLQQQQETINAEEDETEEEEESQIDIYDPGDGNPYTHEYIFKHEPFRYIPNAYYPEPDEGFTPSCLILGVGLLQHEAVAYAEEHGILVPSGRKYTPTGLLFVYQDIASHFSEMYGCRMRAGTVLSRKCDFVLALFDSYSRPEDGESRRELKRVVKELVKIFPAARERCGWFYWAMNDSMYPPGYSWLMYKK